MNIKWNGVKLLASFNVLLYGYLALEEAQPLVGICCRSDLNRQS